MYLKKEGRKKKKAGSVKHKCEVKDDAEDSGGIWRPATILATGQLPQRSAANHANPLRVFPHSANSLRNPIMTLQLKPDRQAFRQTLLYQVKGYHVPSRASSMHRES
jgi:hypothetical protein